MDELKHNLLSISQHCDAEFDVSFNDDKFSIKHAKRKITLVGDCVDNIYVFNNTNFSTLTCLTTQTNDP